jgi:hypothetical protein
VFGTPDDEKKTDSTPAATTTFSTTTYASASSEKDALLASIRALRPNEPAPKAPPSVIVTTKLPDLSWFGNGIAFEAKHKRESATANETSVVDLRDPALRFRLEKVNATFFTEVRGVPCWVKERKEKSRTRSSCP